VDVFSLIFIIPSLYIGESDKLALIQGYKRKIEKELEGI
jgi:hypothetical protein